MSPTKDRLNELKQIQNGGGNFNDTKLIDATGDEEDGIASILQKAKVIRLDIETIKSNTGCVNNILTHNIFKLSKGQQDEVDSLIRTNTKVSHKVNINLKELEQELDQKKDSRGPEYRIGKVQYTTLKTSFQEVLRESSAILEYNRHLRKELLKKSLKAVQKNADDETLEKLLDENKLDIFTDNHLVATLEARRQLNDIEDRHKELLEIEKHLNEVSDLFIKVATLVEQQQESIDRIEYHAEAATDFIEHGAKEFEKGVKAKKRGRRRKIYIALIAAIIIFILILIMLIV